MRLYRLTKKERKKTMTKNRQMVRIAMLAAVLLAYPVTSVTPVRAEGEGLPATGQTLSYPADKNDGIAGPVAVPDDGALRRGPALHYKVRKDGTIKDKNTDLIWEVKCSSCGGLHAVSNTYRWSGDGSQETIWDWLDDINAEGGTGYAGHNDWRIPNVRELQSIVDYGVFNPAIDPIFGPTAASFAASFYWSSTSYANNPSAAWFVNFNGGFVDFDAKDFDFHVRAVRGGPERGSPE